MLDGVGVWFWDSNCSWHSAKTLDHSCWFTTRIGGRSGRFSINSIWSLKEILCWAVEKETNSGAYLWPKNWHDSLWTLLTSTARLPNGCPSYINSSLVTDKLEAVAIIAWKSDNTTITILFFYRSTLACVYFPFALKSKGWDQWFRILDDDWWNSIQWCQTTGRCIWKRCQSGKSHPITSILMQLKTTNHITYVTISFYVICLSWLYVSDVCLLCKNGILSMSCMHQLYFFNISK